MTLDETVKNLIAFLGSLDALDEVPVAQNRPPKGTPLSYVVLRRAGVDHEAECLDDEPGEPPFRQAFDVEIFSRDLDVIDAIDEAIHNKHGFGGSFGTGSIQDLRVADHDEDYEPTGVNGGQAIHFTALLIEIYGYETAA